MTDTALTPLQVATRRHRAADILIAGTYADTDGGFQGCSVGCLAHDLQPEWDSDQIAEGGHALVAETYGYPEWLVHLQDTIFEGLPATERGEWHVQIADAVAARGRDWQTILHAVHVAILRISYRTAGSAEGAVKAVIDIHERAMAGPVAADEWSAAESAARSAAWSAARSAAWSAARSAAESAAESAAWSAAESAARSAAESAARSAAWSAAESAAYQEIRDAVLAEIVKE